jgi:hypothetical protein
MAIKYFNIFQSKGLKFSPNLDFWFVNKPSGSRDPKVFFVTSAFEGT